MSDRAPRVLMVGTALEGRGGVAAVVNGLRRHGLFERERVRYVATHADGSLPGKAMSALAGLWQVARLCLHARPGAARPGAARPGAARPGVVHVHAASHASFLRKSIVLLVARRAGCKTICHLHGGGFRRYVLEESGVLSRRWIRHTLECSSLVIALSEGWAQFVRAFAPAARVAVVPNSVPLPPLAAASSEIPGRILFLGRIEASKGVFELLAAGAALARSVPALRLVFAGEGDVAGLRRRASELGIAERIECPGWLDAAGVEAELAKASVFCLPSHAEGLPMAMLEAMAAGRAVVATKVGGIPETLRDGENGVLVPARDDRALASALAALFKNGALRARLALGARATIEQHYSTEVVCGQLSAIYRELAGTE